MTTSNLVDFNAKRNGSPPVIADTEDGYTRTANAIQDQLCKADLTGAQFQVLNAIVRITYGYNQKTNRITNTYLAELTGISEKGVRLCLAELHSRNMITLEKSGLMKIVGINKVISEWVITTGKSEKQSAKGKKSRNCSSNLRRNNSSEKTEQQLPQDGTAVPDERNCGSSTKDNSQDNLLNTTPKDPLSPPKGADNPKRAGAVIENGKQWGEQEDVDTVNAMLPYLQATLGEHYRPPNITAWANEIRLMRQQDLRKTNHILQLWRLAHTDEFWRQNVQSPSTLRKQWGKLAVLSNSRKSGLNNSQSGITIGSNGQVMTANDLAQLARERGGMN